ncbi:MAG: hypothetical protein EON91_13165 [Brevundimonas sp.]|uniref:serine hydrolase n=1 Tax=Brevundimonas sp. TaxID=1871086 RepID=UPI0011FCA328|nr:serine hydrolase [Brevundimonas sp.]RZJ16477.1 MAG: hypothetical protein EON91_13165 [Brevundimonas sp.]
MKRIATAWMAAALTLTAGQAQTQTLAQVPARSVDALFSQWTAPGAPGCAVAVTRAGEVAFTGAYGQAVIETGRANTPTTAFHIASVSKQFTAFAIQLLAAEGRLSLDDDVRKYVPELHDFGAPITVSHLLHHTSGLRDQWELLVMRGRRHEDTISQKDVLTALFAQRELNFTPGERFAYSNSNYSLLALVVERVSGQAFADFMAARVFQPLGMTDTWISADHHRIRAGQAGPYAPAREGFERRYLPYSNYGATGVRTSAADMARWMIQMDRGTVGGAAVRAAMAEAGALDDGSPTPYAAGLIPGVYRGMRTLEHAGIDPGYAAHLLTLPDAHLGVAVMCNVETNGLRETARRIADLYLGAASAPGTTRLVGEGLPIAAFAGSYRDPDGLPFAIELRDGKLFLQGQDEMEPLGGGAFRLKGPGMDGSGLEMSVRATTRAGPPDMVLHEPDFDRILTRVPTRSAPTLGGEALAAYRGAYYSPELGVVLRVEMRGEQLWFVSPGLEAPLLQPPELLREADVFFTPSPMGWLRFVRDGAGAITEVSATNGRVVALRFLKIEAPGL